MPYRIEIDQDECISSGKCVADAPRAFGFDDEDLAVALPTAGEVDDAVLLRVARNCPSHAIRLHAPDGTEADLI